MFLLAGAATVLAFEPILNVYKTGGGNPVEGSATNFSISIQLEPNGKLQRVQSGYVSYGNGAGESFSDSGPGFVNYYTKALQYPVTFYTGGTYDGTISATVYWVDGSMTSHISNVNTAVQTIVDNVTPSVALVYSYYSQVDDFGNPIPNPSIPRGVPSIFYANLRDGGYSTLRVDWELNEDSKFDDATESHDNSNGFMAQATAAFYQAGANYIRVKVTDGLGATSNVQFPFTVVFQQPDSVTTTAATDLGAHVATLNGSFNLKGMVNCHAVFEYGPDTNYGTTVQKALTTTDTSASVPISGLATNTQYHYRISIADGDPVNQTIVHGLDGTFTTTPGGAPVGQPDTAVANGVGGVTIDVLANDTDPDSDPLSIAEVSTPAFGTAVISSGKIVYTPGSKFKGSDGFTYQVTDSIYTSDPIKVTISSNKGTYTALVSLPGSVIAAPEAGQTPPQPPPLYTGLLTLSVDFANNFTGKLTLGAKTYPIKGQFDPVSGYVQFVIDRKDPDPDLTLKLTLDLSDPTAPAASVTGTVSDGTNTYDIDGSRITDPAGFPAGAIAKYTVKIDPPSDVTLPQGYGFGILAVKKGGAATLIGKRPDGASFGFAGKATDGANYMFIKGFVPNGKGNVAARIAVADDGTNDLTGTFNWNKAATTKGLYQQSFNVQLPMVGAVYRTPGKTAHALTFTNVDPAPAAGTATITDVDATALTFSPLSITFDAKDSFQATTTGTDLFTGKTARPVGSFKGTFVHPTSGKVKFAGLLLQRQNLGFGQYLTPTGAAAVKLTPQ